MSNSKKDKDIGQEDIENKKIIQMIRERDKEIDALKKLYSAFNKK